MSRKRKKKRPRANTSIIVLFCLCLAVSAAIMLYGGLELWEVNEEIARNVETVRFTLRSEQAPAPSSTGDAEAQISHTNRVEYELTARAILTMHLKKEVSVAVYDGTSDEALSMGAGRSEGMAEPNTVGRCVLHGHRDSAFAPLEHIAVGDALTLETASEKLRYIVSDIYVTSPTDPKIYAQSDHVQLVLVTCYPFSFVGPAPERYVVVADAEQGA